MIIYKLEPEAYRMVYICGIAGVWDNSLCWDNPTEEIMNLVTLFHGEISASPQPEEQQHA